MKLFVRKYNHNCSTWQHQILLVSIW